MWSLSQYYPNICDSYLKLHISWKKRLFFIFFNKLFKFFFVNKIFSISTIWIITATYKFAIFSISFYKIVPAFGAFSVIKNYIPKSKWWKWRKISNIRMPSPRYPKFKWQYFSPLIFVNLFCCIMIYMGVIYCTYMTYIFNFVSKWD